MAPPKKRTFWCWCPSRGERPNGGQPVPGKDAQEAAALYGRWRGVGGVADTERLRVHVRGKHGVHVFMVKETYGAYGGIVAAEVDSSRDTDDTSVLIRTFGPEAGWRLAMLPAADPDRQAALAQAALAGDVVGDLPRLVT